MDNANKKRAQQLGMPFGTACSRLRKNVMFSLLQEIGKDVCHRCQKKIETVVELSIEHKMPWLDSADPIVSFFDLNNIAFSHLVCNAADARRPHQKYFTSEDRINAKRKRRAASMKRHYTPEARRDKFDRTGW